jgi:hypothetical protein
VEFISLLINNFLSFFILYMSQTSTYALNQRLNSLQNQVNKFPVPPVPPNAYATLTANQTFTGINTFTQLPESVVVPTTANQLVNKTYADSLIPTPVNAVTIAGNQTLTTGVKTFTNLPESVAVPTTNAQLVNKLYVDGLTPATPTITQVLTAGNNGLDVSQIFSATASTITTNIDNAEVQIINSSGGIYSLLEYDKLTIDDGGGDVHIVDSGGDSITGANASGGTITNTITKSSLNIADVAPAPAWSYQSTTEVVQPFGGQVRFTGVYNPSGYTLDTTYNSNGITQSFPVVPPTFSNYTITTQGDLDIISPNVDITASTLTFNGIPVLTSAPTIEQVLLAGNNANSNSITGVNDINLVTINGGAYPPPSAGLSTVLSAGNTTGTYDIDFQNLANIVNVVNINGLPYPPVPVAPYGLNGVLTISNDALGLSMTGVNNIDLVTINGSAYPPPSSTQDLQTTLGYGNSAGSYSIDMNSQNIGSCNNIDLTSINSITYLPTKFSYIFQTFNVGTLTSGTTSLYGGTSSPTIPVGTYQITYSIQLDGNVIQSGGQDYSVKGYCWLQGASVGQVFPFKVNQGFLGGTSISYNSGYNTCITITDIIQISTADSFQLGAYQENELTLPSNTTYISAIIQAV